MVEAFVPDLADIDRAEQQVPEPLGMRHQWPDLATTASLSLRACYADWAARRPRHISVHREP